MIVGPHPAESLRVRNAECYKFFASALVHKR